MIVARVPWARHGAWHTRHFEDQAAWVGRIVTVSLETLDIVGGLPGFRIVG